MYQRESGRVGKKTEVRFWTYISLRKCLRSAGLDLDFRKCLGMDGYCYCGFS